MSTPAPNQYFGQSVQGGEYKRVSRHTLFIVLGILLGTTAIAGLAIGAYPLGLADFGRLSGIVEGSTPRIVARVFWDLRLPRVALAALIGASLALSGHALQTIFRNPLADPGLIGVATGAALAAVICLRFRGSMLDLLPSALDPYALPVAAFVGALATTFAVLRFASRRSALDSAALLLTGIAINALAGALIGCFIFTADDQALRDFTFWNLGSLSGATWTVIAPVSLAIVLGLTFLIPHLRALDTLTLGDRAAWHLGTNPARVRRVVVIASALLVGAAVAAAGVIGFVGLVVPHLARGLVGGSHRVSLPTSAMLGATLLVAADPIARTSVLPAELPIGIVTALAGTPFFVWLIRRNRLSSVPV